MTKIMLISGLVGAGKSTYARRLAKEESAIRFSIDEWMIALFKADFPKQLDFEWSMERIYRIEEQVWSVVEQLIVNGTSVILDFGLLQREHRQKFYDWAEINNFTIEIHVIEADKDIRWQRVLNRNLEKGATYSLEVNKEMFDFCEDLYERPEADELSRCKFVQTDK